MPEDQGAVATAEARATVMIEGPGIGTPAIVGVTMRRVDLGADRHETAMVMLEVLGATIHVTVERKTDSPTTELVGGPVGTAIESRAGMLSAIATVAGSGAKSAMLTSAETRRTARVTPAEIETAIAEARAAGIPVEIGATRTKIAGVSAAVDRARARKIAVGIGAVKIGSLIVTPETGVLVTAIRARGARKTGEAATETGTVTAEETANVIHGTEGPTAILPAKESERGGVKTGRIRASEIQGALLAGRQTATSKPRPKWNGWVFPPGPEDV